MMMRPTDHIAIIGGGFSGTLMAVNLMRFGGPRVTLIERDPGRLGRGVAYSADHPGHLLNVRAAGMSAFPDEPDHFADWLRARDGRPPQAFVPRATYGAYLAGTLAETRATAGDRLTVIADEVRAITPGDAGPVLHLASGGTLAPDAAILTVGNLPPHAPPGLDPATLPESVYRNDPWASDYARGLGDGDTVVLVGSGLTAVDAALRLDAEGFGGRILALSRRGLAPRRHRDGLRPPTGLSDPPADPLSALVARVRREAAKEGWRNAVDAFRPVTQRIWERADAATRQRFLRHLRPFWDVHRHRLAPVVADRIEAMVARGQLVFAAGKIVDAQVEGDHVALRWRPRHGDAIATVKTPRILNCTGPQGDVTRSADPLVHRLFEDGLIRPDALRLGIDIDAGSHVIGRDGAVVPGLYCIGPMTRGSFWEIVAVPDIRRQVLDLARQLANAHWVAEGL